LDRRGPRFQALGTSTNGTRYPAKYQTIISLSRYLTTYGFRYCKKNIKLISMAKRNLNSKGTNVLSLPYLSIPFHHQFSVATFRPRATLTDAIDLVLCFSSIYPFPPPPMFGSDNKGADKLSRTVKKARFPKLNALFRYGGQLCPPASGMLNAGNSSLTGPLEAGGISDGICFQGYFGWGKLTSLTITLNLHPLDDVCRQTKKV
jgi:hypothetical protein